MSEVQSLPVAEADYKWPDDELVVRLSDYDALAAECERLRAANDRLHAMVNRVVAEGILIADDRDAALAELAALKGGREAVAFVCEASSTHHGCPEGYGDILSEWLPAGTDIYTAPPAQASAWADGLPPAGELCEARIPHHTSEGRLMLWCEVEVISHALVQGAVYSWVKEPGTDGGFYAPMMLSFRKIAAPTPGASDGKGGGV